LVQEPKLQIKDSKMVFKDIVELVEFELVITMINSGLKYLTRESRDEKVDQ
jgi:hypothetical protein